MGWPIVNLGDITEVITKGTTPTSIGFNFVGQGINFIKVESITPNGMFLPHKFAAVSDECNEALKRSQLQEGDILFSIAGALGRTALVTNEILPANTNQALAIIRLKSGVAIDKRYLLLALMTSVTQEQIEKNKGGVAQQNLSLGQLKGFEIPLPPIPEQKQIVKILDKIFSDIELAREKTEQNLKNARELFESYLQHVFSEGDEGWGFYQLSELCELISGQHIDANDYNFDRKGIGYLTGPSDFGHLNPIVTKWTEHPKRTAASGDILITVKGSGVGKVNIMNESELAISRQLMAVRPTGADGEILYWFLSMQFNYFQSLANGAAIPGISRCDVLDLKLSIPPVDAQPLLANSIRELKIKVANLEKIYQQKLIALDELKKSILQKAFTGELTNKHIQGEVA